MPQIILPDFEVQRDIQITIGHLFTQAGIVFAQRLVVVGDSDYRRLQEVGREEEILENFATHVLLGNINDAQTVLVQVFEDMHLPQRMWDRDKIVIQAKQLGYNNFSRLLSMVH